ncbi:MAG: NAD-dependent epimerase/dehydratase family protein [Nitrospirae bacterium]|nr:NAD-dependent epimerase/dehydratase family protein [Nitrospirota bacterium]
MNTVKGNRILITGGAGFIGTHLAEKLCTDNEVVLFDNLRRDSLSILPELKNHPNIKFLKGDVLNKNEVYGAIKGCSMVLHLAAIAGVSSYYKEPANTLRVNLIGTFNVLECCRDLKVEKVVDFSTSEVYGADAYDVNENSNHNIGAITDFRWTYATSKLASEQLTLRYSETYGFKAFTVRPFNIYGPRQTGEGAISNFFRAVKMNEPIVVYGDGTPVRAWCYISDCIEAVLKILENNTLEREIFNIGNPRETYSTLGLARLVCQVVQRDIPIVFKEMDRVEVRIRVPNIDKAKRLLNYKPQVDLIRGLHSTYEWFMKWA